MHSGVRMEGLCCVLYLGLGGGGSWPVSGWNTRLVLYISISFSDFSMVAQWRLNKKLPSSGLKNIFVKLEIVDVFFILFLLLRLSSAAAGGRGKGREGEKEEYNARVMGGVANCEVKNFLLSPPLFVGRPNVVRRKEGGFFLLPLSPSFLLPFSQKFPGSINQCCFHCGGERRKVE